MLLIAQKRRNNIEIRTSLSERKAYEIKGNFQEIGTAAFIGKRKGELKELLTNKQKEERTNADNVKKPASHERR